MHWIDLIVLIMGLTFCAGFTFKGALYTDIEGYFAPQEPWLGGDCATSLFLYDNTWIWFFRDTMYGKITDNTRSVKSVYHNSIGLFDMGTLKFEYNTSNAAYFEITKSSNSLSSKDGLVEGEKMAMKENRLYQGDSNIPNDSKWLWPEDGLVIDRELWIFASVMSTPCSFPTCTPKGVAVIKMLNTKPLVPVYTVDLLPSIVTNSSFVWPTAIYKHKDSDSVDRLYVLGAIKSSETKKWQTVMGRITIDDMKISNWNALTFYAKKQGGTKAWLTVPEGGVQQLDFVVLLKDGPKDTSLAFSELMKEFYILHIPEGTSHLQMHLAKDLTGPWSDAISLFEIPPPWSSSNVYTYAPKSHPELARSASELVITFMSNSTKQDTRDKDLRIYVPQAVQIKISQ